MTHSAALPGFFATVGDASVPEGQWLDCGARSSFGTVQVWHSGLEQVPSPNLTLTVSRVVRDATGAVPAERIAALLRSDPVALTRLLPPFAAMTAGIDGVTMVADSMGFRHLFHSAPGAGARPLASSSSLVAGHLAEAELDQVAVAVQSLLGWQLGQRTLFAGIRKLEPGAIARLGPDGVRIDAPREVVRERISRARAVADAANLLRRSLNALLDDHPDAVLQLTGGMDSRLLLSAIPESRRRGLRAMTLEVPGSGDVAIARKIAQRYGIRHEVHGLADAQDLDPAAAWERVFAESVKLDAMADPVALAAQRIAERAFDQGVRISGLGGEIARGFYYVGRVRDRTYSRADAEQLASWRMFVNEAIEPGLLVADFSTWAREVANDQVYEAMAAGGDEWFRAADHLYLRHRMQRWAGATDTAVSDQRVVLNPMLDPGFLEIAACLAPGDKAGSRFLGALQMELDADLGLLPLEGRPPPAAYADPSRWQPAIDVLSLSKRAARKGMQRLRRSNRPPAGGDLMAGKVVEHWRAQPDLLNGLIGLEFVRDEWIDSLLARRIEPRPSSIAFLTNLLVATSRGQE